MTRSLFVSPVILCFFISIPCQGWRSESGGLEALGLEVLIRQSTGLGYAVSNAMSSEIRAGLGSKALGSEALAREALARRPLAS